MLTGQVSVQIKPVDIGMVWIHQTNEVILPESHLVKGLRHLIKAINCHIDFTCFDIFKSNVRRGQYIKNNIRRIRPETLYQFRNECRLGIVTHHNPENAMADPGVKLFLWLQGHL